MSGTQLLRRFQNLELLLEGRDSDPMDIVGSYERILQRLSPSDRRLIEESNARSEEQHQGQARPDLKEAWDRFEAAADQAFEEGDSVFGADDWRL